jgi:two-component system phosphate regulon response regulator PhoB
MEGGQTIGGGASILLADDSMTILSMVGSSLQRSGYTVLTAARGDDALQLAFVHRPHLAVLDIEMPGLDGLELARRLRAASDLSGIKIILLTAHSGEETIAAGFAAGADDYMVKPFSPQELQTRVEQLLGRS